jgi:hypothetical protein
MKALNNRPNPSNKPQAFESDQGIWLPPHSSPRNKQTMLEMKNTVPGRSILAIFSFKVNFKASRFGSRNVNNIIKTDSPPKAANHQFHLFSI